MKKLIRTVSALLYTENNEVLLHRHPKHDRFLGPGGKVHDNEYEAQALLREVYEETGILLGVERGVIDHQRTGLTTPWATVKIDLDSGDTMIDHVYCIKVDPEIRQQKLQTESEDNEMDWYDVSDAINNFPLYEDTKAQLQAIRIKLELSNRLCEQRRA